MANAVHEFAVLLADPHNTHRIDEQQAETHFRRALDLRMRAHGAVTLQTAETMFALGL